MQKRILYMYKITNLVYILTILECIEKSWLYTKKIDNANDLIEANDQKELNAIISIFIAIGEETKKIDDNLKNDISKQINWKQIAGIRDKISHNYRGVDEEIIWSIIQNDLILVKNALLEMLKLLNPDKLMLIEILKSPYYKHIQF